VAGVYGGPAVVVFESWESTGGGAVTEGARCGEGGMEEAGEGASTIHMRWERVATILAMVWARVLVGLTWKTGYES
jgi:hypothetical protein